MRPRENSSTHLTPYSRTPAAGFKYREACSTIRYHTPRVKKTGKEVSLREAQERARKSMSSLSPLCLCGARPQIPSRLRIPYVLKR